MSNRYSFLLLFNTYLLFSLKNPILPLSEKFLVLQSGSWPLNNSLQRNTNNSQKRVGNDEWYEVESHVSTRDNRVRGRGPPQSQCNSVQSNKGYKLVEERRSRHPLLADRDDGKNSSALLHPRSPVDDRPISGARTSLQTDNRVRGVREERHSGGRQPTGIRGQAGYPRHESALYKGERVQKSVHDKAKPRFG